jgi:hypothetical protein
MILLTTKDTKSTKGERRTGKMKFFTSCEAPTSFLPRVRGRTKEGEPSCAPLKTELPYLGGLSSGIPACL